ncbi:hypothetical protein EPUS_01328 [Endocarpon pusillum Z07020]|uniref:C2H2-type domain-containing protein n=1 Tax=Endocarpon pusillum (strain Z07020 / HMAS-L-300199) TaxID=1263415 RepID=U1GEB6_ENDPU|nr:uncharacterized protein EPUS_01328 [Endocarpon pusillum Z07020]ERF75962.1 hypothetical protein EPUS_01328 [Endocarpon pusillum Z07020]
MASKNVEVAVAGKQSHLQNWINDQSSNSHPSSHFELGFVTSFYQECCQSLAQIWDASQTQSTVVPKRQLQESITRFVLWGSGWSEGRLDFCLNGSVELRNNVIELLSGLAKALLQICDSHLRQPKPVTQEHVRALIALREQARQFSVPVDSDSEASDSEASDSEASDSEASDSEASDSEASEASDSEGEASDSEVCLSDEEASTAEISVPRLWRRALENIEFHTKCLMDLLPSMEQTYKNVCDPGLRLDDGSGKVSFRVTKAARPYVLQVHDKFRNASISLAERLGEANWQRFMRVRQRMAGGLRANDLEDLHVGARSTCFPASKFHDSGPGSSLRPESSLALTNASHSSFVSNLSEKDGSRARVPATPNEVAEGISFECFICRRILTKIKNRIDWKIHVFADLQPYICTFDSCRSMLVTFPNRKAWSEHELTQHRTHQSWRCRLCATTFTSETSLAEHSQLKHELPQHYCKLLAASSVAKSIDPLPVTDERCPLCLQEGWPSRRKFETHVGRHLEEIALSVLPRDVESDSDQQSDADATSEVSTWSARDDRILEMARTTKLSLAEICEDYLPHKSAVSCQRRTYPYVLEIKQWKIALRLQVPHNGNTANAKHHHPHQAPVHEEETIRISKLDNTRRGKAERQRARTAEEDFRIERKRRRSVQDINRELAER